MMSMDATLILLYLTGALVGLLVQFAIIRWAVLSALSAHAEREREFARKVAAARAATTRTTA